MFSRIRQFLSRHRQKIIVSSLVVGGIIFITRHTQRKIREWQEKEIKEMLERSKRRQYFESTERTCNQMILSLSKTLRESIIRTLDAEAVLNKLRSGCEDKVVCWNQLKVLAIAKSSVVVYSHVMLVILLRIQINLIGGYMYKDCQNTKGDTEANEAMRTKYISLCGHFMNEGIKNLSAYIQEKVEEITASMSLKDELTLRDLEQIYWAIMSSVSANSIKDPIHNLFYYMLPEDSLNDEDPVFTKLMNETLDLLESKEVQELAQSSIRSGFVLLIDHISEYFADISFTKNGINTQNGISVPGTSNQKNMIWTEGSKKSDYSCNSSGFVDLHKVSIHMAKLIPIINGQVPDKPSTGDLPDDWQQQLILNENLKMLGANIYEAFSF